MTYRKVLDRNTVLDRKYRIDHVIGAGGFGITYEAFDLGLETPVAIKEYFPEQFGVRDETLTVRARTEHDRPMFERLRASFLREGRTLAQFDNPAIVAVLNVFEANGTAYMVMRFENGKSFKDWLTGLRRPPSQVELDRIAGPVLDALEVMHAAEFLHRDIAPDNIIIRPNGTPVILDFGASRRVMGPATSPITGVIKIGFSPQEQYASDGRSQGPWTDIYAMAATLYRAVTGGAPMAATDRMLDDHMRSAREAAVGDYRPEFLEALDFALNVRPQHRPQSVAEWRARLFGGAGLRTYGPGASMPVPPVELASGDATDKADPDAVAARGGVTGTATGVGSGVADAPGRSSLVTAAPPPDTAAGTARPVTAIPEGPGADVSTAGVPFPTPDLPPSPRRPWVRVAAAAVVLLAAGGLYVFARPSGPVSEPRTAGQPGSAKPQRPAEATGKPIELAVERKAKVDADARAAAVIEEAARRAGAAATLAQATAARTILVQDIRRELIRIGCQTDAIAPDWGDADQKALELFVRSSGGSISFLELNRDIVTVLGGFQSRVCPLQCGTGEVAADGRCQVAPQAKALPAQNPSIQCNQINERAQLGVLTDADRELLRSLKCR